MDVASRWLGLPLYDPVRDVLSTYELTVDEADRGAIDHILDGSSPAAGKALGADVAGLELPGDVGGRNGGRELYRERDEPIASQDERGSRI
ncbi:hypothetical protein [Clavibacter michiganensis]|uniref:hypothetical protein n=1 Tax=Clavibacter michiganensis TaxID=28447 RepID=UPI00292D9823|nr:hypothetical protein [Clavibacter michiganensis]